MEEKTDSQANAAILAEAQRLKLIKKEKFLIEYESLCRRHGFYIESCGCCFDVSNSIEGLESSLCMLKEYL